MSKKADVYGRAIHDERLFHVAVKEIFSAPLKAYDILGPDRMLS
ncbi:hypothetical protein [Methylobacterium trifolii]|nr:hypothetical protein [Methylobacterium trifolii]